MTDEEFEKWIAGASTELRRRSTSDAANEAMAEHNRNREELVGSEMARNLNRGLESSRETVENFNHAMTRSPRRIIISARSSAERLAEDVELVKRAKAILKDPHKRHNYDC